MKNSEYYNQKEGEYKLSGGREMIIRGLVLKDAKTVLDVGCGSGDLARILTSEGRSVSGVDISAVALAHAEPYLKDSFCFDIQNKWPEELTNQRFDLVVVSEVIEHIFMPADFLEKAKTILRPESSMIITTPNFLFWKNRLKMLFGKFRYEEKGLLDFGHIRFFTLKTAREIFDKTGFTVQQEQHFYPNLYQRRMNFLGRMFPGFFAYQFGFRIILAK